MNIIQLLGIMNILENNTRTILKIIITFLLTEGIWFFVQTYEIYRKIVFVLKIIQFGAKCILIFITMGPIGYHICKLIVSGLIKIREWILNFIRLISYFNNLLFLRRKKMDGFIDMNGSTEKKLKPRKMYKKIEIFRSIDEAFSHLKKPLENHEYKFR
jgi:hypothetical protein